MDQIFLSLQFCLTALHQTNSVKHKLKANLYYLSFSISLQKNLSFLEQSSQSPNVYFIVLVFLLKILDLKILLDDFTFSFQNNTTYLKNHQQVDYLNGLACDVEYVGPAECVGDDAGDG